MLVKLCKSGNVILPKEFRDGLDEDSLVDVVRRDDGVIELRPRGKIDPSQRWYWSERWQQMEREAREDYAAGRFTTYGTVEEFLHGLDTHAADAAAG